MHPVIHLFSESIGVFPLCAGIGLLGIGLTVFYQLRKLHVDEVFETRVMIALPFSLLFGVCTGYLSDLFFRGGIAAFRAPAGYGVTFYGWLLGCILFYFVYAKICHLRFDFLLNLFLPAFALAQAWGRIGCFCGGCCFGRPLDFCGVVYPPASLPFRVYGDTPLFPVQLVESFYLFALFFILFACIRFKKRALWYLALMASGRFFFEFLRGDNRGSLGILPCLSPAQVISLVLCTASVCILFYQNQKKRGKNV